MRTAGKLRTSKKTLRCPVCGNPELRVLKEHNPDTADLNMEVTLQCGDVYCLHEWEGKVTSRNVRRREKDEAAPEESELADPDSEKVAKARERLQQLGITSVKQLEDGTWSGRGHVRLDMNDRDFGPID